MSAPPNIRPLRRQSQLLGQPMHPDNWPEGWWQSPGDMRCTSCPLSMKDIPRGNATYLSGVPGEAFCELHGPESEEET